MPLYVGDRHGGKGKKRKGPEDQCGGHVGNIFAIQDFIGFHSGADE
jgi:hypothetical protein